MSGFIATILAFLLFCPTDDPAYKIVMRWVIIGAIIFCMLGVLGSCG